MKPRKKAGGLLQALALLILTTLFARAQTNISVSREYSLFQFSQSSAPGGFEGISREYSLFQFDRPSATYAIEAMSREVSGYNYGYNHLNVAVGSAVVQAGTSGSVPVTVSTIVPMSNVMVAVDFPPNLLTNWLVVSQVPYAGSVLVSNNSRLYLMFSNAVSGQTIQSSNQVLGQIQFASASNQPSAFLPLPVAGVTPALVNANAFAPSMTTRANGEVVVVHTNSLLRMYRGSGNQWYLTLYGLPETSYTIESATNLMPPVVWQTAYSGLLPATNLIALTPNFGATNRATFYRARQ